MDLQAHRSEPRPGDLPAEEPGGGGGLQAEAAAPGRRQEEAPAPAAGLRRPAVGGRKRGDSECPPELFALMNP